VLGLTGIAIISPVVAMAVDRPSRGPQLDTRAQMQRVLPPPNPQAFGVQSLVRRPSKRPARRVWKQMPRPVRLSVPAIGVSARIIRLGLNRDGTAQTPVTTTDTGWFAPGPEPGEKGAAVIIGHVDSKRGPGVFFRLRALRRGDRITVTVRGGRKVLFAVTGARQVLKARFPTALVFARTSRPTLRLVTCGGRFDPRTGHYLDNTIVFARLVGYR
jgi:sortase (surface protein transpeptidase)